MLSIPGHRHPGCRSLVFGGEFPATAIVGRLYIVHVLLIPAILVALITRASGLIVRQKHTQFPGARTDRDQRRSAGTVCPIYAAKAGGFFFIVFGVLAALGGVRADQPDLAVRARTTRRR